MYSKYHINNFDDGLNKLFIKTTAKQKVDGQIEDEKKQLS